MPPTTRRTTTLNSNSQQSLLNFKSTSSARVTKAGNHVVPGKLAVKEEVAKTAAAPVKKIVLKETTKKETKKKEDEEEEEEEEEEVDEKEKEKERSKEEEEKEAAEKLDDDTTPTGDTTISTLPLTSTEISLSKPAPFHPSSLTPFEKKALALSPSQISAYYHSTVLSPRRTAPVHQQRLSQHEKILRHFDLSSSYGPCIGITRLNRWKRAHNLGLSPPVEVLAVCLMCEREGGEVNGGGYGGDRKRDVRNAYVDEFLSTKTAQE